MGLRDDILAVRDGKTEELDIPEWQTKVWIRTLSGRERDALENLIYQGNKKGGVPNIRAEFAVRCLCDADGKRLFADPEAKTLGEKSAAALDRIFEAARRFNKFDQKDVEELEKNSESGQSDNSG